MRESRTYGSVRGALSNERPYRDRVARNDGAPKSESDTSARATRVFRDASQQMRIRLLPQGFAPGPEIQLAVGQQPVYNPALRCFR